MAKKDKMLAGLGNLNIDTIDDALDKSKEQIVKVDDKEYTINYLQFGTKIITLKKEKGTNDWETVESNDSDTKLKAMLKIENAKSYAIQTKNAPKFQSGIYLDNKLNDFIKMYLMQLNAYLTSKNGKSAKKVTKADLTDNIIYDFLAENTLIGIEYKALENIKAELDNLGNEMLEITYKDLPLKSLLRSDRSKQGLYINLNLFENIVVCSDFIFTEQEGGKAMLINNILKNWFIKKGVVHNDIFIPGYKNDYTSVKYASMAFAPYFEMDNKIADDNHKF